ncbi:NuoI/complex I 23 kDa subunit family protein [Chondromyces apiculatus]|uniref:NADH-quinone oxidoreductase subunit I n=1 Tax=Chondromyces apiculatus DSM 436 TaxID=1192034 RepID=A0A017TCX2_9BACT|nr:NADH-quinone oxidoreductase subunit I [Chondromyces apiculatus]EYF07128.1 NADH-ubiquinone oxidoreductase chain I [Chondromyces apiculatus DSM 436]
MAKAPAPNPWTKPRGEAIKLKVIPRPQRTAEVQSYVPAFLKGMSITMRHFFKNTKEMVLGQKPDPVLEGLEEGITTINYPEEKRPYPERFRGLHRLTLRQDDSPRCVACLCCSTACPAQCIHIVAAEYPEGDTRRGYERYPSSFVIDELRCIFCGFCVEACPCDAIRMDTGMHATAYDSREQFIYKRELLMSFTGRDGSRETANPRHEPGDETHPGVTREHMEH